ncbi:hypothetical protein, partial [Vreelandella olivaria]|uniref:hypothetical protein n=1 Tax=Vreelandella olivaria TaxID=390919 RepID=UPI00201E9349
TNHSVTEADIERLGEVLMDMMGASTDINALTSTNHSVNAMDVERLVAVLAGLVGVSTGTDITAADIERWAAMPADLRQDAIAADLSAAANLDSLGVIRSVTPNIVLPSNSLFQINAQPTARYLVETDPRFTNQREWLGSDYMLDALASDPSTTQRRLGDGFYEQRLINEQIMQLTGQRYLEGY